MPQQYVWTIPSPFGSRAVREGAHDGIGHAIEDRRGHIDRVPPSSADRPDGVGVIEHQEQRDALPVEIEAVVADCETDLAGETRSMRLLVLRSPIPQEATKVTT